MGGTVDYVVVENLRMQDANGTKVMFADVSRRSSTRGLQVEWQVEFRDLSGRHIGLADTRWTRLVVGAGETAQVQIASSDPTATDFLLKIRD